MHNLDGLIEVINARCEDETFARCQRGGDVRSTVGRTSDEEIFDWDGCPWSGAAGPGGPRGVELHGRNEDVVVSGGGDVEVGRLSCHGAGRDRSVWLAAAGLLSRETLAGGADNSRERLVPDTVGPAIELAIPDQPLLLRAVDDSAAVEFGIGDETAAGERRTGAIIHEGGESVHVNPAHRRGLRHRPEFAAVAAEVRRGHVDGQVRQRSPEVIERDAVAGPEALVVYIDGSVDDHVARREAETRYGGVVADLKVKRMSAGPIRAGLEQQCIALSSELVGHLLAGDGVDGCLNLTCRHAVIEDNHVRTEVRRS